MSNPIQKAFIVLSSTVLLFVTWSLLFGAFASNSKRDDNNPMVKTWEDDPQNWHRAFRETQPSIVQVIHSKVWERIDNSTVGDHTCLELIHYFELQAPTEWKKAFVQAKRFDLELEDDTSPRKYRTVINTDETPDWFAPGPSTLYDRWNTMQGSIWIHKTNGHLFFWEAVSFRHSRHGRR
jgi:hypothetical protein